MTNISPLYTPQAGGTPNATPASTGASSTNSGLFAGTNPANSFLDMLAAFFIPTPVGTPPPAATAAVSTPAGEATTLAADLAATETKKESSTTDASPAGIAGLNPLLLPIASPPVQGTPLLSPTLSTAPLMTDPVPPAPANDLPAAPALVDLSSTSVPPPALGPALFAAAPSFTAPVDPAALNAINPGRPDGYTDALNSRLKAQLMTLLEQNGVDVSTLPVSTPVQPAAPTADDAAPAVPVTTVSQPLPTDETVPSNTVAAALNAMTVGGDAASAQKSDKAKAPTTGFDMLMKGADINANTGYQPNITPRQNSALPPVAAPVPPALTHASQISDSSTPSDTALFKLEITLPGQVNGTGLAALPVSANGHTVNHGVANGTTPTTATMNAIALHVQSMAQNRNTQAMTLTLDPPELGKLQVRMSFGKDKTVKADVLVEKSDTFSMLQKDTDALRQALSNAGLNADAGSLNFSLADQGAFDNFMQSNADASNSDAAIGDAASDVALIEIKSSEEWSVDPRTGIVRYNIVV